MCKWLSLIGLVLLLSTPLTPQDAKAPAHNSPDPHKCKRCSAAYDKALDHIHKNLGTASFPAKMVIGWLLLADGRFPNDLKQILNTAMQWDAQRGKSQHAQNWYPALAGMLLAVNQQYTPTVEGLAALQKIVDEFVKVQERTGGWFKWFEGAYNDRKDYPVKDLGMLDSIIFGFLWNAKTLGCKVPDSTMEKADKCITAILGGNGISYGTGQHGGDPTGARGAYAMLGLNYAGQTQHKICKTYEKLLERCIPSMDKGHHIGAFHGLGLVLGCHYQGPAVYSKLIAEWLDKLIDKQDADGGLYIGDDGDAGGEPGLLHGNTGSTAAFALMILLQDGKVLRPQPPKAQKQPGPQAGNSGNTPANTPTKASSDSHPWLGLHAKDFAGSLEVESVASKGPSESAGLQIGDLIVEFRGKKIEKAQDLRAELDRCSPGQKASLIVLRGSDRQKIDVQIGALPKSKDSEAEGEGF